MASIQNHSKTSKTDSLLSLDRLATSWLGNSHWYCSDWFCTGFKDFFIKKQKSSLTKKSFALFSFNAINLQGQNTSKHIVTVQTCLFQILHSQILEQRLQHIEIKPVDFFMPTYYFGMKLNVNQTFVQHLFIGWTQAFFICSMVN